MMVPFYEIGPHVLYKSQKVFANRTMFLGPIQLNQVSFQLASSVWGRFSTCNFFTIFFISSISGSYGTKMIFNINNRLNQGIKQKVVGPLFFKRNSTCTRFTFSGSDLVPLWIPAHNLWLIPACDIFVTRVCIYATYQIVCLRHYAPIISYNSSWHTIPSMCEVWRLGNKVATTYGWYSV